MSINDTIFDEFRIVGQDEGWSDNVWTELFNARMLKLVTGNRRSSIDALLSNMRGRYPEAKFKLEKQTVTISRSLWETVL